MNPHHLHAREANNVRLYALAYLGTFRGDPTPEELSTIKNAREGYRAKAIEHLQTIGVSIGAEGMTATPPKPVEEVPPETTAKGIVRDAEFLHALAVCGGGATAKRVLVRTMWAWVGGMV